jgi:hypothetical protein
VNRALERALVKRAASHSYGLENGRIVVREPDDADGGIVCTMAGDCSGATLMQADAICAALDKLMRAKA